MMTHHADRTFATLRLRASLLILLASNFASNSTAACATESQAGKRRTICLDGTWQVADSTMDQMTKTFAHLKTDGTENELVIRGGASLAQIPLSATDGWDPEKARYVPGIYDSVTTARYFATVFNEHYHCTPQQFREQVG